MNYLYSILQTTGSGFVNICPTYGSTYSTTQFSFASHPLSELYRCEEQSYKEVKKNIYISSPSLIETWKVEKAKVKNCYSTRTDRAKFVIEKIAKNHFESLDQFCKNKIYGTLYHIVKPITDDPCWGENHRFDNIPLLIDAMNMHQYIENTQQTKLKIWENEEGINQPSCTYELENRPSLSTGEVGYINGVGTTLNQAKWDAYRLSDSLCKGHNIQGVYSATHGVAKDGYITLRVVNDDNPEPVMRLLETWNLFFLRYPNSEVSYLQICFSQGVAMVQQAVKQLPQSLRKRIEIIAIAPASFIPKELGCKVKHFVKMGDVISVSLAAGRERLNDVDEDIIIVPDEDKVAPHDPHGSNYTEEMKPYIHSYIENGSIT